MQNVVFLSIIDDQIILFKNFARYVNHSCNPNAKGPNGRDFAIRDIEVGEEITVDYVEEQVPNLDIVCNCGSPNCRKILSQGNIENVKQEKNVFYKKVLEIQPSQLYLCREKLIAVEKQFQCLHGKNLSPIPVKDRIKILDGIEKYSILFLKNVFCPGS